MIDHVLDDYYLAITFLVSLGLQGALFVISFSLQTDKLTDLGEPSSSLVILVVLTSMHARRQRQLLPARDAHPHGRRDVLCSKYSG